jgi:uncharacterized membrane protein YcgQ (UPF0703/DUF1980 family)
MSIQIENIVIMPFVIVFFICWFAFSLLLIIKPHAWFDFQNRHSRQYGFEWHLLDEKKFTAIHRKVGFWLIVLGVCALLIILGYVSGFIPIIQ